MKINTRIEQIQCDLGANSIDITVQGFINMLLDIFQNYSNVQKGK